MHASDTLSSDKLEYCNMLTWEGFTLVLGGAFLFALFQIINKNLINKAIPSDCIGAINSLGSGILLFGISYTWSPPLIESWFVYPTGLFWPLIATSLLNIVIIYGNLRALKYGDVSLIGPIAATQPLAVIIPSWLILGEVPGTWGYIGLWLLAVGFYVFSISEHKDMYVKSEDGEKVLWTPPSHLRWLGVQVKYVAPLYMLFKNKGVRIALLVALCGAISINFDKSAAMKSSVIFAPAFILTFLGIVGMVKTLVHNEWKKVKREHVPYFALNMIVYTVVIIMFWSAFDYGFAAYIGALKRFQVVFILALGFLLLKETGAIKRWPGAAVMTIGAALLSL